MIIPVDLTPQHCRTYRNCRRMTDLGGRPDVWLAEKSAEFAFAFENEFPRVKCPSVGCSTTSGVRPRFWGPLTCAKWSRDKVSARPPWRPDVVWYELGRLSIFQPAPFVGILPLNSALSFLWSSLYCSGWYDEPLTNFWALDASIGPVTPGRRRFLGVISGEDKLFQACHRQQ